MSIIKARLSTSYLDKHNEKMSLGALQSMMDIINHNIIPVGVEHDPRVPPLGRILNAELTQLEDGEYAIDGEIEMFDENSTLLNDGRELTVRSSLDGGLGLSYDRNFKDSDLDVIKEIGLILSTKPHQEIKKAFDFMSVLTIIGTYALTHIADGLLKDVGVDPYSLLKDNIKKLFSLHLNPRGKLLLFDFLIKKPDETQINTQIIINNPTNKTVDFLFDKGFRAIDNYLAQEYSSPSKASEKRLTFEVDDHSIKHSFSVTKEGIPIKKQIDIIC